MKPTHTCPSCKASLYSTNTSPLCWGSVGNHMGTPVTAVKATTAPHSVYTARQLLNDGWTTESVEAHIQRTFDCGWREAQNTVEVAR